MDGEKVLLHILGEEQCCFLVNLASLTDEFMEYQIELLDIEQSTFSGQTLVSLLISSPSRRALKILKKRLEQNQKLHVSFSFFEDKKVLNTSYQKKSLIILFKKLDPELFLKIESILCKSGMEILQIYRLARGNLRCFKFNFSRKKNFEANFLALKEKIIELAFENQFDIAFQNRNQFSWGKKIIVFDMDSTLIQQEVINELASFANMKEQVAQITDLAVNGKIEFRESLSKRVALLENLEESILKKTLDQIQLTLGVKALIPLLKKIGFKTGVISSGFTYFTEYFQKKLNLDYSFGNQLEIKNGKLTGKIIGEIIDSQKKATILKELALKNQISLSQTVAVGDGANDLDMLQTAGLGIAFNANQQIQKSVGAFLNYPNLSGILYLLGFSKEELKEVETFSLPQ